MANGPVVTPTNFSSIVADEDAPETPRRRSRLIIAQVCARGVGRSARWKIKYDPNAHVAWVWPEIAAALCVAE